MRFSVFCGQDPDTLAQADEIYLRQKDYDLLIDLIDKYPDKDFALDVFEDLSETQWKELSAFNQKINGNIYCSISNIYLHETCKKYSLPFYYAFPVNTFFELKALKDIGVSYIRLGMPIFFQTKDVASFGVPVRLAPNKAYDMYIPREDTICGQWVRPEDLHLYEEAFPAGIICEFEFKGLTSGNFLIYERTLLKIYKEGKWPGRLQSLIKEFSSNCINSLLDDDIGHQRLNCAQRCQLDKCHYCYMATKYAETLETLYDKKVH